MTNHRWFSRRLLIQTMEKALFPLLLFLIVLVISPPQGKAAEPSPLPSPPSTASSTPTFHLDECLHLGLERAPRLAVARATLAAAADGKQGLESLHIPAFLDPEIPVRRRQAALAVMAASANLDAAERETTYAITRTYFTVLYARAQERVARNVVERLSAIHNSAKQALDAGARDVTAPDVDRALVYLRLAQTKHIEATQGIKRALAALKEAMGLGFCGALDIAEDPLPAPTVRPNRDEIVALALARRSSLIQSNLFAQITCLEVEAQATSLHLRMATLAAGGDIHARQVPQGRTMATTVRAPFLRKCPPSLSVHAPRGSNTPSPSRFGPRPRPR